MAVRPPSLRTLFAFEAAARHGAFWEAARELNLTDSAVSHSIRALEQQLGRQLFRREARGVVLTEAGRELYARLSAALGVLNEALEIQPSAQRSTIVVACDPAFASRFLAPRLHRFCDLNPEVVFDLRTTPELAHPLDGAVDVGIFEARPEAAGQGAREVCPIVLVPLASPSYAEATRQTQSGGGLIVDPASGGPPPSEEGRIRLRIDDYSASLAVAASGAGVAIAPQILAADDLDSGRLIRLDGAARATGRAYWIASRPAAPKAKVVQAFCDWVVNEAQALSAPPAGAAAAQG